MHGNVWEWCEDNWHDDYQGAPYNGSVWLGGYVSLRVLRGGAWDDHFPSGLASGNRYSYAPTVRNYNIGFRVARTL
jgi:formylglycine-generating enzyme required for sulfatase activity